MMLHVRKDGRARAGASTILESSSGKTVSELMKVCGMLRVTRVREEISSIVESMDYESPSPTV